MRGSAAPDRRPGPAPSTAPGIAVSIGPPKANPLAPAGTWPPAGSSPRPLSGPSSAWRNPHEPAGVQGSRSRKKDRDGPVSATKAGIRETRNAKPGSETGIPRGASPEALDPRKSISSNRPKRKAADMRMRTLGGTGIKVSPYCLGAMMFGAWGNPDHEESIRIIHAALD